MKKSHKKKKNLIRPAFLKPRGKDKKETKNFRPKAKVKREKNFNAKIPVCHKCGRIGHYANSCWTKERINELQIDESLKRLIEEKLLTKSDEENRDSNESSVEEEDPQINQLLFGESDDDDSKEDCECNHYKAIINMNGLCINVLTKEESLILKVIDKIENPEEKQKTLEEYILINKENY